MGSVHSSALKCAESQEPQEVCRLLTPCNLNTTCRSVPAGILVCPQARADVSGSILPGLGAEWEAALGFMVLLSTPVVYPLVGRAIRAGTPWRTSYGWRAAVAAVAPQAQPALHWAIMAAAAAAVVGFDWASPVDVWGGCEHSVCVYHMMFCEATRHGAAVRHPANFYSNLLSLWMALFLLCEAAHTALARRHPPRPFAVYDALFGTVLLLMSLASFTWHASNCTWVHFIDLGLMYSVIAWFPLRCASSIAVHVIGSGHAKAEARKQNASTHKSAGALLSRVQQEGLRITSGQAVGMLRECDGHVGQALNRLKRGRRPPRIPIDYARAEAAVAAPAVAAYALVTVGLVGRSLLVLQPMFDEAFPTGRSRTDIRTLEVLAFVATPALYPSLALVAVAQRRAWGHAGAMQAALVCLTVGFAFQASERLGLDLYCYPYAWLQPTAVLHVCSALTIVAGYVWLRSIEAPPPETEGKGGMTNRVE